MSRPLIGCPACRDCPEFKSLGYKGYCKKLKRPIKFVVDGEPCPCEEGSIIAPFPDGEEPSITLRNF